MQQSKKVCVCVMFTIHILVRTCTVNVVIVYVDFDCKRQFAIIEFEKPVYCAEKSLVIGSRLDTDAYILHLCLIILNTLLWVLGTG